MGYPKDKMAVLWSTVLTGKAVSVYSRLSERESKNYDVLKSALLKSYDLNGDSFHRKFRHSKLDSGETYSQLIERLSGYLKRWIDLSGIDKTYNGLTELMVKEQLYDICPIELRMFLKERKLTTVTVITASADQYVEAHGSGKQFSKKGSKDYRPKPTDAQIPKERE
ncbi:hypothetical protein HOLleu_36989 [Holothuria leucospilota]|uniref:SCAN box domain-containing protein n=1 Tax=Holothuria leucospilota TaxID=206669 RepID=A0A9Q1BF44_HOLLE|nr:hypothetical protein HOLleu_36989 [Holothuria leucospilota]